MTAVAAFVDCFRHDLGGSGPAVRHDPRALRTGRAVPRAPPHPRARRRMRRPQSGDVFAEDLHPGGHFGGALRQRRRGREYLAPVVIA